MVDVVSPGRFRQLIAEDPSRPIIDTRPTDDFDAWHIPGAINAPWVPDAELDAAAIDAASDSDHVLTVCGFGISSIDFATELEARTGAEVSVIENGMVGWSQVYDVAEVDLGDGVTGWQVQRLAKGCLGYVIGCERTNEAVAVDVPIHLEEVLHVLDRQELTLVAAVDTHIHADHVSGTPALAERTGVPYHIGAHAADRGLAHEHRPLADGDVIEAGDVTLTARHTPGHTSDSLSLVIGDETAVLTADTLFVDAVGRTELEGDADERARTRELFHSLMGVLLALDDGCLLLPGHVDPGEDRLHDVDTPVSGTIAEVRETVAVLELDADAFVDRIAGAGGERPPNYRAIILVNLGSGPMPNEAVISQLEQGPNRCAASA